MNIEILQPLAYPVVVLILGGIALFVFKQPITRLLDRTNKVGRGGLEAQPINQTTSAVEPRTAGAEELLREFDNALVVEKEKLIKAELTKRNLPAHEREQVLTRYLVASGIALKFEKSYSAIWGSQLWTLQRLNSTPRGIEAKVVCAMAYEPAKKQWPEVYTNYSFEQALA